MSLSSDFGKSMAHKAKPAIEHEHTKIKFVEETAEMPKEVWDACEAIAWRSTCCQSQSSGELSQPWHDLKAGGESILTREGTCAKCGKKANFVRKG